jgi:multidrug resistance protein MdtO
MATIAQTMPKPGGVREFVEFVKEELAPYPGRAATVARMVIAATLAATICLTFKIPYGFEAALFVLFISREDLRATVTSGVTLLVANCIGTLYLLISISFVINEPMLHFLWNVGSFFLAFYLLSILSSYLAAVLFAVTLAVGLPLWDSLVPAEGNVENVLWLSLAVFVGVAVTLATEFALVRTKPGQEFGVALAVRLAAVHDLLVSYAEDGFVNESAEKRVVRLGFLGTSKWRSALYRSGYERHYRAQIGALFSLIRRLVDMAGALAQLRVAPTETDRAHLRDLAAAIDVLRGDVLNRRVPLPVQFPPAEGPNCLPLLNEMEGIVALIPEVFAGSVDEFIPPPEPSRPSVFVADAFVNPDHLKFALKGCLAASACYFAYNAVDWRSIGTTAVATCLLTGLSTIGTSRQKQILRVTGIFTGGIILGMGAQIFILPQLDSIGGFIILFALVTAVAGWFATCTPRISYFGLQIAFAYYFVNVSDFRVQTSLSVARDRIAGALLGSFAMWLAFDQIWGAPAGVEMRRTFVSNLRLLAQFSKQPTSGDIPALMPRIYALRETINSSFDKVQSLADGVLFEFGPSRRQDMEFRDHIRQWQPKLRTLFLMRIALLEDRLQLSRLDLPETVRLSLQEFDDHSSQVLEGIANRIEGPAPESTTAAESRVEPVERALNACCKGDSPLLPAARVRSLVALLGTIDNLTTSLDKEIVLARPA